MYYLKQHYYFFFFFANTSFPTLAIFPRHSLHLSVGLRDGPGRGLEVVGDEVQDEGLPGACRRWLGLKNSFDLLNKVKL